MDNSHKKNLLDNEVVLVILFFIFPPLGIYGVLKRNTLAWKKILYTLPALFLSLLYLIITISLLIPNKDYYDSANEAFENGWYEEALNRYKKVDVSDRNFQNAKKKIDSLTPLINKSKKANDDAELKKIQEVKILKERLIVFQKKWADSVVKVESKQGNRHLVASKLILPDTILFEYTESVTRKGFEVNLMNDKILYNNWYQNDIKENLGEDFPLKDVFISCIPNSNVNYNEVLAERKTKSDRAEKIRMQFSVWDGSHSKLKRLVKDNMNDPDSFDHEETTYDDKGKYVIIQMRYRGKNSFGALVIETITAKADIEGNIFEIE